MIKILVIEDDKILGDLLCTYLQRNNFNTTLAQDGLKALEYLGSYNFDLILLDLILPKISGEQVLKYLNGEDNHRPIIVITSETSDDSELMCYKNGSNIFHRKPINCKLLLYQIQSVLREKLKLDEKLSYKDIVLYPQNKLCLLKNKEVKMPNLQYSALEYFLNHKDRLITKKELCEYLYGDYDQNKFKNLDTIVFRIKKRLDETVEGREFDIRSSKGFGYRI